MEVELISKEFIKTSSPTPHPLKTHKLSFLDHVMVAKYVPIVLFYPPATTSTITNLKTSLSETLTCFYPFAGKITGGPHVECDDEGALFFEAEAKFDQSQIFNNPNIELFEKLVPAGRSWDATKVGDRVAMIQLTTFTCGGVAIGIVVSHKVADFASMSYFLKSWAAITRKSDDVVSPNFDAALLFPCNDGGDSREVMMDSPVGSGMRRFVFDASAIARLKDKATCLRLQNPTRVEVVSALLGKCIMATLSSSEKSKSNKLMLMSLAVNMRRRAFPALPDHYMGNYVLATSMQCNRKEVEEENPTVLVSKVREAISKIDSDFIHSLIGENGVLKLANVMRETVALLLEDVRSGKSEHVTFSSWCNFGVCEIDFGWGNPTWGTPFVQGKSENFYPNTVILLDTKSRDGIEAWVSMDENKLDALSKDRELLQFASIDQSILEMNASN